MTKAERDKIFADLQKEIDGVLGTKGEAYIAGNSDVLSNFTRNAERLGMTPFQVWAVYFNKHIDTILNAIHKNPEHPVDISEGLDGRILNGVIYLGLLKCLLVESGSIFNADRDLKNLRGATVIDRREPI